MGVRRQYRIIHDTYSDTFDIERREKILFFWTDWQPAGYRNTLELAETYVLELLKEFSRKKSSKKLQVKQYECE